MNENSIHIIATGGTIDSYYDAKSDTAVPREHSILPRYLDSLNLYEKIDFTEVCMKDSRQIKKEDIQRVCETVEASSSNKILITHGTYTMPDTARYLKSNLKNSDNKVIIFTGSMIPLEGFSPSDAGFNLGFAIAKLSSIQPGIYVCMNGRVFDPEEVIKVLYEGRFDSIFSNDKKPN